jgi:hypothetical protein
MRSTVTNILLNQRPKLRPIWRSWLPYSRDSAETLAANHRSMFGNSMFYPNTEKIYICVCRSQWPCGIRRRSTAAPLLRSWVRIPPGHGCLSVLCVRCCQVEVSATSWSLVRRSTIDCGASLCVIKKSRGRGGHSPRYVAEPEKIIIINNI